MIEPLEDRELILAAFKGFIAVIGDNFGHKLIFLLQWGFAGSALCTPVNHGGAAYPERFRLVTGIKVMKEWRRRVTFSGSDPLAAELFVLKA